MPLKQKVTRVAAYGLIVHENKILLCRLSSYIPSSEGFWTLPGGGLDFAEDPQEAMMREVAEETGLIVRPEGLAGIDSLTLEDDKKLFHGIRIIYHTKQLGGSLRNELEGSTDLCAWWTFEEAKTLPLVDLTEVGLKLAFPEG